MTPKEKAQYLVDKFTPHAYGVWDRYGSKEEKYHSKQCALIAINEMIKIAQDYEVAVNVEPQFGYLQYWLDVKQEIEKL